MVEDQISLDSVNLTYVFPGIGGAPVNFAQRNLIFPDIRQALEAVTHYTDSFSDISNFNTSQELNNVSGKIREIQAKRMANGESFWQSLNSKSPVLPKRFLFRGQSNWKWALLPSLFQGLSWGTLPWTTQMLEIVQDEIRDRNKITNQFKRDLIDAGRRKELPIDITEFTQVQVELTSRHYGFPSVFLDFTTNPKTAAFFASENDSSENVGIIYVLDLYRLNDAFGVAAVMPGSSDSLGVRFISQFIQLGNSLRINLTSLADVLFSMETVSLDRVRAQNAVFLNATEKTELLCEDIFYLHDQYWIWYALDFLCRKFCFYQKFGKYEDELNGITYQTLMPPNDPIHQFVLDWKTGKGLHCATC